MANLFGAFLLTAAALAASNAYAEEETKYKQMVEAGERVFYCAGLANHIGLDKERDQLLKIGYDLLYPVIKAIVDKKAALHDVDTPFFTLAYHAQPGVGPNVDFSVGRFYASKSLLAYNTAKQKTDENPIRDVPYFTVLQMFAKADYDAKACEELLKP